MKKAILAAILSFALRAHAILFFGGVTDDSLFSGEYPFGWPDQVFSTMPWNEATCQDSCTSYQQLAGNDPGYKAITNWLSWVNQHNLYTIWYAGYVAARSDIFVNVSAAQFTAYVQQIAALPGAQGSKIYINIANEAMHGTGLAANNQSNAFIDAMGGKGATGYDWLVNIGKRFRRYFPKAKLGINDFSWESIANDLPSGYGDGSVSHLSTWLNICSILKKAGVIDWAGGEGYGLESVDPQNLKSALDQVGSLGLGVVFTEFSPGTYDSPSPQQMLTYWQTLLPALVADPNVVGVVGPWTFRLDDEVGSCGIIDDRQNPVYYSPTAQWLQSYIPSVLASAGPTPAPTPTPLPTPTPAPTPTATPSPTPTPVPTPLPCDVVGQTTPTTSDGSNNGSLCATKVTLGQSGTLSSVNMFFNMADGQVTLAVYDNTGKGGMPGQLLAETAPMPVRQGWNNLPPVNPGVLLAAGTYWIAYEETSSLNGLFGLNMTTGTICWSSGVPYGPMPCKFPSISGSDQNSSWEVSLTICPIHCQ